MDTIARKKIMVVDDNKPLLRMLSDFLAYKGYDITTAETGEEALMKVNEAKPDVILLDIGMPGMGGIGFLRKIMTDEGKLLYPVLVLTARTLAEDTFTSIDIEGIIAKPCDKNKLVEMIQGVLAKRESSSHT